MGKQGPCRHCGVTSTPLWRNGPPEKPVLCNACGSRWRTKGSLVNYIPLHAREAFDSDELKVSKIKCTTSFKHKEQKSHKKKQSNDLLENEWEMQYCDQNFHKLVEGDTSNRSSSGSAMSGSDSCVNVGTIDASDVTGSVQSKVYDLAVQCKKRTFSTRPKASVEKLTKDLHSILHEEQASNLSRTTDDDLLYESSAPLGSFEIGYGGVLIKHPNSKSVDEESEASSFPVDKPYITNEGYSVSASFPVNTKSEGIPNSGSGTEKTVAQVAAEENAKRDKSGHENSNILLDRDSALGSADLNVIVNFECFMKYLTHEERQQLMKYLPYIDIIRPPESVRNMFTSPQFLVTLSYFQQLLRGGVFDLSLPNAHAEECRILKRLVLLNNTEHQWLEYYQKINDAAISKNMKGGDGASNRQKFPSLSNSVSLARQHDWQKENQSELKSIMRSTKCMNPPSRCSAQMDSSVVTKVTDDTEDVTDHDGTQFCVRRIFASPPDTSSVLAPMQFVADSSEGDMLLDAPVGTSFPEAELLYHPWKQKANRDASPTASTIEASDLPSSSFINKCFKNG